MPVNPITAWVVSPPKVGSTWLSMLLSRLLGWRQYNVIPMPANHREQEIFISQAFKVCAENVFIPHTHTRATEPTVQFVDAFNVKVIMLKRNIYDTIISLRDHLVQEGVSVPCGYITPHFKTLSGEAQLDYLISQVTPWYLGFYTSWSLLNKSKPQNVKIMSYETLLKETTKAVSECLSFIGCSRTNGLIEATILDVAGQDTRKNVGITGRGKELSTTQILSVNTLVTQCSQPDTETLMNSLIK